MLTISFYGNARKIINNRPVLLQYISLLFLKILPKCDFPPCLVSGNFDSSVGSKFIYFKVVTNFLLKKKLNSDRKQLLGKAFFPFTKEAELKYIDFSQ